MPITIYHNPNCATSRNTLEMIRASGENPDVIEYLTAPPSRERLHELLRAMGCTAMDMVRKNVAPFYEYNVGQTMRTDDELVNLMILQPLLINRPIVVTPLGVKLCRPSEVVLDILPNPDIGRFVKEDGGVIEGKARAGMA